MHIPSVAESLSFGSTTNNDLISSRALLDTTSQYFLKKAYLLFIINLSWIFRLSSQNGGSSYEYKYIWWMRNSIEMSQRERIARTKPETHKVNSHPPSNMKMITPKLHMSVLVPYLSLLIISGDKYIGEPQRVFRESSRGAFRASPKSAIVTSVSSSRYFKSIFSGCYTTKRRLSWDTVSER